MLLIDFHYFLQATVQLSFLSTFCQINFFHRYFPTWNPIFNTIIYSIPFITGLVNLQEYYIWWNLMPLSYLMINILLYNPTYLINNQKHSRHNCNTLLMKSQHLVILYYTAWLWCVFWRIWLLIPIVLAQWANLSCRWRLLMNHMIFLHAQLMICLISSGLGYIGKRSDWLKGDLATLRPVVRFTQAWSDAVEISWPPHPSWISGGIG